MHEMLEIKTRTMYTRFDCMAAKAESEIRKQAQGGMFPTTTKKPYGQTILRVDLPKRLIKPC
ncbi:MAG TPA: hypothetical protein DCE56_13685 [Cyanobacteria bacterium UBA8553]|nr:hypothetical protein [Cyanobacteria bacterium UBA8553]HAJ61038.1 hypothetical protein [Cyanobacteria bacterium UBA8543]